MTDIDAMGMRDLMHEAIRIATSGTQGFHVSYSPTATEFAGWAAGSGGLTVRETHQAMEAIASPVACCRWTFRAWAPGLEPRIAPKQ